MFIEWNGVSYMNHLRNSTPSVARAADVLQSLAHLGPLGTSELARQLGYPKASVFRILGALENAGLIERVQNDQFDIGPVAFEIGSAFHRRNNLEGVFRKIARSLVEQHNETVQLAILVDKDVLYIAKEESSQPVRLVSDIGSRLPAHVTSLGKALLSSMPEEEVRELYGAAPLTVRTTNSHSSIEDLIQDLRLCGKRGWAVDNEETSVGLRCVGGAVRDQASHAVAAMSISIPCQRAPATRIKKLGQAVERAAAQVSTFLGYRSTLSNRSDLVARVP